MSIEPRPDIGGDLGRSPKITLSTLPDGPTTASLVDYDIAKELIIRGLEAGPGISLSVQRVSDSPLIDDEKVVITVDAASTVGEANTLQSLGGGISLIADVPKVGTALQLKSLVAYSGITITPVNDELLFSVTPTPGPQGEQGEEGTPGSVWYNGELPPDNNLGRGGDYYLDNSTGEVYTKSQDWDIITSLKGPQGDQGFSGTDGIGVPPGGTTGQYLVKVSDDNYDTTWANSPAPGARAGLFTVVAYFNAMQQVDDVDVPEGWGFEILSESSIKVTYPDYLGYPAMAQFWGQFFNPSATTIYQSRSISSVSQLRYDEEISGEFTVLGLTTGQVGTSASGKVKIKVFMELEG